MLDEGEKRCEGLPEVGLPGQRSDDDREAETASGLVVADCKVDWIRKQAQNGAKKVEGVGSHVER